MACKKIVVIGPESTGKSTLCEGLAAHYHTEWVREYAREYLQTHGMEYTYDDLSTIARGQLALEDAAMGAAGERDSAQEAGRNARTAPTGDRVLFIDTDLYVMKIWSEYVFGRCETWILKEIVERHYDGYLLCRTDLSWADDPLREYPDLATREKLFHIYRDLLINQNVPWVEVGGEGEHRLKNAIEAVARMTRAR
jgi:NadR type nicotinamide-nucleotide adenylyltransferase